MLRTLKRGVIATARESGLFKVARNSSWRRRRLLILCYHGISQGDEHLWDSQLYMSRESFIKRMELLKRGNYNVLPLSEALNRLSVGDLPPSSVAITFDDGWVDFYRQALPVLESYSYPATVYLTTFYSDFNFPIFNLICSYMLWKSKVSTFDFPEVCPVPMPLRTVAGRVGVLHTIEQFARHNRLEPAEKNDLASQVASRLGLDFQAICDDRMLHLMNPSEVRAASHRGIDIELHTHRHRVPSSRAEFEAEVRQNSARICSWTGSAPVHFCYPSGDMHQRFLPWLRALGIASGVTCEPGLATARHNPLLLPRLIDTSLLSTYEFESWLSGASAFLPRMPRVAE